MIVSMLIVAGKEDVDNLLFAMNSRIKRYGNVTVGELYRLVSESSVREDDRWGWTSTEEFNAEPVGKGFQIKVPAPEHLYPEGEKK